MAKFGKLIDSEIPILFGFYNRSSGTMTNLDTALDDVIQDLEGRVKVYKIEASENPDLVSALKVNALPSYVIYNRGKMVWRNNAEMNGRGLVQALKHFL